eukprot:SM000133S26771  [mRNA]  locus=s133:21877:22458:+ [translate_table: standard]
MTARAEPLALAALLLGWAASGPLAAALAARAEPLQAVGRLPWHLLAVGLILSLLKLPGARYPGWARACLPLLADGGLARVAVKVRSWRAARRAEAADAAERELRHTEAEQRAAANRRSSAEREGGTSKQPSEPAAGLLASVRAAWKSMLNRLPGRPR